MPPPCEQPLWQAELDKRSCSELILKLARALDRCDEVLMRSLFHDDATDDHGYFRGSATEFVDWVLPLLATMERNQHNISNILVNVRGDRAVSEAYFVAYHDWRTQSRPDQDDRGWALSRSLRAARSRLEDRSSHGDI